MYLKTSQLLKFEVLVNEEGHGFQILIKFKYILIDTLGFPGDASGKESTCQCRRHKRCGFIPGLERPPGGGKGNPLQYSCLENSMDRGAWRATVHGVAKSQTRLNTHTGQTMYCS